MMTQDVCEMCPLYGGTEDNDMQAVQNQWYCYKGYDGWYSCDDSPPKGCTFRLEHMMLADEELERRRRMMTLPARKLRKTA
jgi:hypothetical protein